MKRLATLVLGLLLVATQLLAAPTARAADLERILSNVIGQLPIGETQRRASLCTPYDISVPGPEGGTAEVSGEGCFSGTSSVSVTGSIIYSAYGVSPGVTIDGSSDTTVQLTGDLAAGSVTGITVVLNGGPVTYTINSETYTITHDNFTIEYIDSLTPVSASGGITINDVYYPATIELAGYII